jgi:hypothetical protein
MESWMLEINNPNLKWTKEAFEGPCYEKRARLLGKGLHG